jgi:hypothetical protein
VSPAIALAERARVEAMLIVLQRGARRMTVAALIELAAAPGPYRDDLAALRIGDLRRPPDPPVRIDAALLEEARLMIATAREPIRTRHLREHLGIPRWTAQAIMREFVARGVLVRRGAQSTVRYFRA